MFAMPSWPFPVRDTLRNPRVLAFVAATFLYLSVLACRAGVTLQPERPYEEMVGVVAVERGLPAILDEGRVWSEHPPLGHWVNRGAYWLLGSKSSFWACRIVSCLAAAATFAALARLFSPVDGEGAFQSWGAAFALLAMCNLCVLTTASRGGPAALAEFALAATLLGARRLLVGRATIRAGFGFVAPALALAWSHVYGIVFSAAIACAMALTAATGARPAAGAGRVRLALVAGLALSGLALTTIAPDFAAWRRLELLKNHYWAQDIVASADLPFANVWFEISPATPVWPRVFQAMHAGLLAMCAAVMLWRRADPVARVCAFALGLTTSAFYIVEATVGEQIWVPHFWGCGTLLMSSVGFLGAGVLFGAYGRAVAVAAATALIVVPTLHACLTDRRSGDEMLREAAAAIDHEADSADVVVFGGSRCWAMFASLVDDDVHAKARVLGREGLWPDSFAGLALVPPSRLETERTLARFHARRAIFVQLDAAQSFRIDITPWPKQSGDFWMYPSYTIGGIRVMKLEPEGTTALRALGRPEGAAAFSFVPPVADEKLRLPP